MSNAEARPNMDELEASPYFNPDLIIPKYGVQKIIVHGRTYLGHNTNNMILLVEADMHYRGETSTQPNLFSYAIENDLLLMRSIFDRFTAEHPVEYDQVADIVRRRSLKLVEGDFSQGTRGAVIFPDFIAHAHRSRAEKQLEELHKSQMYVSLVPLARQVNPEIHPQDFCD